MPLFEMLSNRSMLVDNKCPNNNINFYRPVEIHYMHNLSELNKDVSEIDEIISMVNRNKYPFANSTTK